MTRTNLKEKKKLCNHDFEIKKSIKDKNLYS
jgi:hypothetical protein